jgi:hypothetical protein
LFPGSQATTEHENKIVMVEAIQRTIQIVSLISLRREPAVLAYHFGKPMVSANPGLLRRKPGAPTPQISHIRNPPYLQSSFLWEPVALAYHLRYLVALAILWTGSQ